MMSSGSWHFRWWFGANFPKFEVIWKLTLPEMAAASFLGPSGHYSSLIARGEVLRKAYMMVSAEDNPFDNDRMLTVALATQGAVLYKPLATAFVLLHATQDQKKYNLERWNEYALKSANWMMGICEARGIDFQAIIAERIAKCPFEARPRLNSHLNCPWCISSGRKIAVRFPEIATHVPLSWHSDWPEKMKAVLRQILPPIVIQFGKRILDDASFKPKSPQKNKGQSRCA
jgi:hypothetical protein